MLFCNFYYLFFSLFRIEHLLLLIFTLGFSPLSPCIWPLSISISHLPQLELVFVPSTCLKCYSLQSAAHIALSWLMFLKTMSMLITLNMLMSPGTQWVDNPLPTSIGRHNALHPLKWLCLPPHADRNCHFHQAPIVAN